MSTAQSAEHAAPQASSFKMILVLGATAMVSGLLLNLVYSATYNRIEANYKAYLEGAIFQVVQGAEDRATFAVDTDAGTIAPVSDGDDTTGRLLIYACYDASGALVGIAIPAQAQGYAGPVEALYGYDPVAQTIVGMTVLKSNETPGLGDKIKADEKFHENFDALDVAMNAEGTAPANPITVVKGGKSNAWEIDAIAGATISSKCVATMLLDSSRDVLPLVQKNLDLLKAKP